MPRTAKLARLVGVDEFSLPEFFGCGCCGRENPEETIFCTDCEKHLDPDTSKHAHDRTWFAQSRTDCPFSEVKTP